MRRVDVEQVGDAVPVAEAVTPFVAVRVAQHEERVEQDAMPGLPLQDTEAHEFVRGQVHPLGLQAPHQVQDGLCRVEPHPRGHGVEEQADGVLDLGHGGGPARDSGAEHDVLPSGHGRQDQAPGGVEHGVDGQAVAAGLLAQFSAEAAGQHGVQVDRRRGDQVAAFRSDDRRFRETGQRLAPRFRRGLDVLPVQPAQEVHIGPGGGKRPVVTVEVVEREQLLDEQPGGPAVPEQQVPVQHHAVAPVPEPDQFQPEQRRGAEVEPCGPVLGHQLVEPGLPLVLGQRREIHFGQWGFDLGRHELDRSSQPLAGETRPEAGDPAEQRGHRRMEPFDVQAVIEVDRLLDGVDVHPVGVVAGVEEQAFLKWRQRPDVGDRRRAEPLDAGDLLLGQRHQFEVGRREPHPGVGVRRREVAQRRGPAVGEVPGHARERRRQPRSVLGVLAGDPDPQDVVACRGHRRVPGDLPLPRPCRDPAVVPQRDPRLREPGEQRAGLDVEVTQRTVAPGCLPDGLLDGLEHRERVAGRGDPHRADRGQRTDGVRGVHPTVEVDEKVSVDDGFQGGQEDVGHVPVHGGGQRADERPGVLD
ncbi:hypothetical protein C791_0293 [Amycolatopsis azurea DSM 43854]|uniref:Uncharacterized protein n=1 Tax=Amycolatopsis azurea DSM 43854 TaxID=1238180 RepID=M2NJB5_9PSEU|nr:hypothetical protein C791_0293 [Amycolatopsis azurea DSM 43854]